MTTTTTRPALWTPGDWNAYFGFGTNILVNLLVMTGLLWFVRDFHFFAEESPLNPYWFQQVSYYSLYFAHFGMHNLLWLVIPLPFFRLIMIIATINV